MSKKTRKKIYKPKPVKVPSMVFQNHDKLSQERLDTLELTARIHLKNPSEDGYDYLLGILLVALRLVKATNEESSLYRDLYAAWNAVYTAREHFKADGSILEPNLQVIEHTLPIVMELFSAFTEYELNTALEYVATHSLKL